MEILMMIFGAGVVGLCDRVRRERRAARQTAKR
jgi:hypothetical protein